MQAECPGSQRSRARSGTKNQKKVVRVIRTSLGMQHMRPGTKRLVVQPCAAFLLARGPQQKKTLSAPHPCVGSVTGNGRGAWNDCQGLCQGEKATVPAELPSNAGLGPSNGGAVRQRPSERTQKESRLPQGAKVEVHCWKRGEVGPQTSLNFPFQ